jgi:hypothetical protein
MQRGLGESEEARVIRMKKGQRPRGWSSYAKKCRMAFQSWFCCLSGDLGQKFHISVPAFCSRDRTISTHYLASTATARFSELLESRAQHGTLR